MSTELRVITPDDWEEFRGLRLQSLADSPDAFGVTLAEAATHTPSVWRDRAAGSGQILHVTQGNDTARRLYERRGFVRQERCSPCAKAPQSALTPCDAPNRSD